MHCFTSYENCALQQSLTQSPGMWLPKNKQGNLTSSISMMNAHDEDNGLLEHDIGRASVGFKHQKIAST